MRQGLVNRRLMMGSNFRFLYLNGGRTKVSDTNGFVKVEDGILKCKSNTAGQTAFIWFPVLVPMEGYIEVLFEAKRYSGSSSDFTQAGGVGYNQWSTQSTVGGNLVDWIKIKSAEWETYRFVIPGSYDKSFMAIFFGCFTNTIGEYWFRRIEINYYNQRLVAPDVRFALIRKESGTWKIVDDVENANQNGTNFKGYANHGVYKVEEYSNFIRVYYDWMDGWGNPIIHTTVGAWGGRYGWQVAPVQANRNYCNLYVIRTDGTIITPSTITDMEFHFTARTI